MSHDGADTGIRSLECIRQRCHIDDITGCWLWRGSYSGRSSAAHIQVGVFGSKRRTTMTAQRAAWLFAGNTIEPGHSVYRKLCGDYRCCNPKHIGAGTAKDRHQAAAARGAFSDPQRLAKLTKHRTVLPAKVVKAVNDDIAAGMTFKAAAKKHGIHKETAGIIGRGEHVHQRAPGLNGASVFGWRPA